MIDLSEGQEKGAAKRKWKMDLDGLSAQTPIVGERGVFLKIQKRNQDCLREIRVGREITRRLIYNDISPHFTELLFAYMSFAGTKPQDVIRELGVTEGVFKTGSLVAMLKRVSEAREAAGACALSAACISLSSTGGPDLDKALKARFNAIDDSVSTELRRNSARAATLRSVALQGFYGLAALDDAGFVHFDLKENNITLAVGTPILSPAIPDVQSVWLHVRGATAVDSGGTGGAEETSKARVVYDAFRRLKGDAALSLSFIDYGRAQDVGSPVKDRKIIRRYRPPELLLAPFASIVNVFAGYSNTASASIAHDVWSFVMTLLSVVDGYSTKAPVPGVRVRQGSGFLRSIGVRDFLETNGLTRAYTRRVAGKAFMWTRTVADEIDDAHEAFLNDIGKFGDKLDICARDIRRAQQKKKLEKKKQKQQKQKQKQKTKTPSTETIGLQIGAREFTFGDGVFGTALTDTVNAFGGTGRSLTFRGSMTNTETVGVMIVNLIIGLGLAPRLEGSPHGQDIDTPALPQDSFLYTTALRAMIHKALDLLGDLPQLQGGGEKPEALREEFLHTRKVMDRVEARRDLANDTARKAIETVFEDCGSVVTNISLAVVRFRATAIATRQQLILAQRAHADALRDMATGILVVLQREDTAKLLGKLREDAFLQPFLRLGWLKFPEESVWRFADGRRVDAWFGVDGVHFLSRFMRWAPESRPSPRGALLPDAPLDYFTSLRITRPKLEDGVYHYALRGLHDEFGAAYIDQLQRANRELVASNAEAQREEEEEAAGTKLKAPSGESIDSRRKIA